MRVALVRRCRWLGAVLAGAALTAGCGPAPPATVTDDTDLVGLWRGTLLLPGGELPFGLEFARENGRLEAFLINGDERLRVTDVRRSGARIELGMPGYQHTLEAQLDGTRLAGAAIFVRTEGERQRIEFRAERGRNYRFFASPLIDNASVEGRWSAQFTDAAGRSYPAVGEFTQRGHEVRGTFLTPTGDFRFLAGEVRGQELWLSKFDGAHTFLLKARFVSPQRLEGRLWSGVNDGERFVAVLDPSASLDAAAARTELRAGVERFTFAFPDLAGQTVSLDDARFRGKVVVVTLAGSWCPNCHDEALLLAELDRRFRAQGLEIVALMFERYADFARAAEATRKFRDDLGIEYLTLIAGTSQKEAAAARLPALNGVFAFPTTLFIDRRGAVRKIHTGFSGPATGTHYTRLVQEFTQTIESLLAES